MLEGHFLLSSGLHSPRYVQCARVLMDPPLATRLGAELAERSRTSLRGTLPTVVVAPALGGVLVAHEVARALRLPRALHRAPGRRHDAAPRLRARAGRAGGGGRGRHHHRRVDPRGPRRRARPAAPCWRWAAWSTAAADGRPRRPAAQPAAPRGPHVPPDACPLCARGSRPGKPGSRGRADAPVPLYRLTLAYDGTDFPGWQAQERPTARAAHGPGRAGGGALPPRAAARRVRVAGAGRTDAGVHALGPGRLVRPAARDRARTRCSARSTGCCPPTCACWRRARAPAGFHAAQERALEALPLRARHAARAAAHAPALRRRTCPGRSTRRRSQEAAALFVGRHDFASLASAGGSVRTTVRTVTRSEAVLRGGARSSTRSRPTASCARWCAAWWAA